MKNVQYRTKTKNYTESKENAMTKETPDRRVQKTRKLMEDALVDLIMEKGYDKVSVQDIIERANVGRSTFYAHYQDKDDLLLRGVTEIAYGDDLDGIIAWQKEHLDKDETSGSISFTKMFMHVQENERLHKALFSRNQENIVVKKGTNYLYAVIKAQLMRLVKNGREPAVPIPFLAQYLTGGLMSLIKWWLENDMSFSVKEMDELFQKIAMPSIRSVFE